MSKTSDDRRTTKNYRRILIVRLDRIGDVVLSTPVIRSLREAYPASHIAFMVRPYAYDIVAGNPFLDEVIIYDKRMGLLGTLKFIRFLRKRRFDLALILHPTSRTNILTFLACIPKRVGFDRKMGFALNRRAPHTKQFGLKHEIDYTLDLVRYIGVVSHSRTLHMPISGRSEEKVNKIFARHNVTGSDPVIVINPGASCHSKRWRPERFADVADRLARKHRAKIVLIAGGADKAITDRVASFMKGPCINLAGATTVADIASILRRSRLFISNDSGPVHIACAVGTPVIAIFGRSDRGLSPRRWGPSNPGDVVLHKDVGCIACLAHNCSLGFKCLEAITVDDVVSAANKILEK